MHSFGLLVYSFLLLDENDDDDHDLMLMMLSIVELNDELAVASFVVMAVVAAVAVGDNYKKQRTIQI
jgi:hypothetical protein